MACWFESIFRLRWWIVLAFLETWTCPAVAFLCDNGSRGNNDIGSPSVFEWQRRLFSVEPAELLSNQRPNTQNVALKLTVHHDRL
jgi:hypothetical protein